MILRIHMRPSRLTEASIEGMRTAFAAHPGDDPVEIVLYAKRVVLPVSVDGESKELRAAVRDAGDEAAACFLVDPDG